MADPAIYFTTVPPVCTCAIPFMTAGGSLAQDNTNFFWDNSNNRLGIGTTAPRRTHNEGCELRCTASRLERSIERPMYFPDGGKPPTHVQIRCMLEVDHDHHHEAISVDGTVMVWT